MDTPHRQVPVLGFKCDAEIAKLANNCGIQTTS
jgi:hypothetical protein